MHMQSHVCPALLCTFCVIDWAVDMKVSINHNGEAHWALERRLPGANILGPSFPQDTVCATECLTCQACNSTMSAALPWPAILNYGC